MLHEALKSGLSETLTDVKEMIYIILPVFVILFLFNFYVTILDNKKKRKLYEHNLRHKQIRLEIDEIKLKLAQIQLAKLEAIEEAKIKQQELYETYRLGLSNSESKTDDLKEVSEDKQQEWENDLLAIIQEMEDEENKVQQELYDLEQQKDE